MLIFLTLNQDLLVWVQGYQGFAQTACHDKVKFARLSIRAPPIEQTMAFYFRKSVNAGPFRFTFSRGGVGMSVGVKGLRIGSGPRGHYVHAGRGGLYYRNSFNRVGTRKRQKLSELKLNSTPTPSENINDHLINIESTDVYEICDDDIINILNEIKAKNDSMRVSTILCYSAISIGLMSNLLAIPFGIIIAIVMLPVILLVRWVESYRRTTVLFYELEPDAKDAYEKLTEAFDGMMACAAKWHIEAGAAVHELAAWKRNAGATHIVRKQPTTLSYALPTVIKSNITPPAIRVGRQVIYFFPDAAFVEDQGRIGAVGYSALKIRWQQTHFIEEGPLPSDAVIVDYTWKYKNKNGRPDKRFANNYQLPVCNYEAVHFSSDSGLNELIELSQTGSAGPFVNAVSTLACVIGGSSNKYSAKSAE